MGNYYTFERLNNDKVLSLYSKRPMNCNVDVIGIEGKKKLIEEIENDFNYKFKKVQGSKFQVHGSDVDVIKDVDQVANNVDGLLTNLKGVALEIRTADCQSIFLYDPKKEVIGNIHSGWKGTYQQIVVKAINKMIEEYDSNIEDIEVYINPSILGCCFEVQDDVIEKFREICDVEKYYTLGDVVEGKQKYYLDTVAINYDKLVELGIKKEHIFLSNICTMCHKDEYFSYRGDNRTDCRNISIICLK